MKGLTKIDWNFLSNKIFQNDSAMIFEKVVIGLLDKFAPLKRKIIKGFNAPWVTSNIINECRTRDALRKDSANDPTKLSDYRKQRNQVNELINKAKRKYFNDKYKNVKSSVDVWNVMNEMIDF